jgi:hypothetical protein
VNDLKWQAMDRMDWMGWHQRRSMQSREGAWVVSGREPEERGGFGGIWWALVGSGLRK